MTPEELDEARVEEARRRWNSNDPTIPDIATAAARLARENWTPPEHVVDPDVLAFREWLMEHEPGIRKLPFGREWLDNCLSARAYRAGARMAREQERKRAKVLVEYVEALGYSDYRAQILAKYRGES